MIRFFRGSGMGPLLVVILAALALWMQYFITPPVLTPPAAGEAMPLWGLVAGALEGLPFLAVLFSFALMLIVAITMVRFNTSIFFIPRRTYLPALFYILLFGMFPGEMVLNPALPAAILILTGFWRMISAYRINGMAFNFFDAALFISSAGMFYAGSVWLIILVIIGALILRSPDPRELTVTVAGAVMPWLVLYGVWFVTGGNLTELTEIIRHNLFDDLSFVFPGRAVIVLLVITGLNFIPALISLVRDMPRYKIRSRKTFELFIWMMFVCAVAYLFAPGVSAELNAVTAIPVAFIMANYLVFTRRLIAAEILFWLMAVMLAVSRVWPY